MVTIDDVLKRVHSPYGHEGIEIPAPKYTNVVGLDHVRVGLAVSSMRQHMTSEGWELFEGLGVNGYALCGYGSPLDGLTSVRKILELYKPGTLLLQDKREWDCGGFRDKKAYFRHVNLLNLKPKVFKLTVLKDAQQRPNYHRESAVEMGCHAWVVYYHPRIVKHVAPYVRGRHLIRTYHTVNAADVPAYSPSGRKGCLLSGATIADAYPLRLRLFENAGRLPHTDLLYHPGYHRNGSATPDFLKTLSRYRVSICTASKYGYTLRKLTESTACGCVVITDLPVDDPLPEIDGNLIRVPSSISAEELAPIIQEAIDRYDPVRQEHFANKALRRYNHLYETGRLAAEIEKARVNYGARDVPTEPPAEQARPGGVL